jgi:hypothetical protein
LPRFAGPIAEYVFAHPQATRTDLIGFLDATLEERGSGKWAGVGQGQAPADVAEEEKCI